MHGKNAAMLLVSSGEEVDQIEGLLTSRWMVVVSSGLKKRPLNERIVTMYTVLREESTAVLELFRPPLGWGCLERFEEQVLIGENSKMMQRQMPTRSRVSNAMLPGFVRCDSLGRAVNNIGAHRT